MGLGVEAYVGAGVYVGVGVYGADVCAGVAAGLHQQIMQSGHIRLAPWCLTVLVMQAAASHKEAYLKWSQCQAELQTHRGQAGLRTVSCMPTMSLQR